MKTNECPHDILFLLRVHIKDDGNRWHAIFKGQEVYPWVPLTLGCLSSWNCGLILCTLTTVLYTKHTMGISLPFGFHGVPSIKDLAITQLIIEVMSVGLSNKICKK